MRKPPQQHALPQVAKLLVFRFGQIGDTVAALPSLWVLRRQFPGSQIAMLSELPAVKTHLPPETVLPPVGLIDRFIKYPGGSSVKNFFSAWRQIRQLRKEGFQTLVYLTPSARTKKQRLRDRLFFRLCGISHLLAASGFYENWQPRSSDGSLISLPKEADAILERLKRDGFSVPGCDEGCMNLQISDAERAKTEHWWRDKTKDQAMPNGWFAICTGGKTSTQLWPWERYAEVACRLVEKHGLFPVIIGGREDRETGARLLKQCGTGLCAAGELTVRESAALLANARFYLGNDTGVMHLAAAAGTPCAAVFSARNWPGIWEPYGKGHKILRFDVPCSGCQLAICDRQLQCLTGIQVEDVYHACAELLRPIKSSELTCPNND